MEFETPSYTVDRLIRWIDTGRLALPEFQREFVWPPAKVVDLLDSVARGWPIGSLLMLEGPQPFMPKPIDQGPALGKDVRYYVLDGQQRITALYHAISDASDVVYLANFAALTEGDRGECFTWKKRKQSDNEAPSVADRAMRYQAKVSEVFDATKFHSWQAHLTPARATEATALRERFIGGLKSQVYKLPTILLAQEIELEALARIFEAVNRTGVRLNAFDLMVAVLYPHNFNLRDTWDDTVATHQELQEFHIDGLEFLKLAALRERRSQQQSELKLSVAGVRQGDVLMVPPGRIKRDWERCTNAYVEAIRMARRQFGVLGPGLLPADSMLLALAFAVDQSIPEEQIRRWYWSAIANQSFAQGANTQVTADADRMVSNTTEWGFPSEDELTDTLLEPVKRNQLLLRGIAGLLVSRGARDPRTKLLLSDTGIVNAISLTKLAAGDAKLDLKAPLADAAFFSPDGAKMASGEIRKGREPNEVLDRDALASQGILSSDFSDQVKKNTADRASRLAQWFAQAQERK